LGMDNGPEFRPRGTPETKNARCDWSSVTRSGTSVQQIGAPLQYNSLLPNLQHQYLHSNLSHLFQHAYIDCQTGSDNPQPCCLECSRSGRQRGPEREVSIDHDLNYDRILKVGVGSWANRTLPSNAVLETVSIRLAGKNKATLPTILRCWKRTYSRNLAILWQQPIAPVEAPAP